MSVQVGDKAPDFTLKNQSLEEVSLSDYLGKKNVVILFFPMANTSVCEKEMCSTRDGLTQYEDLDAEVLAISVDSPFSLKLWAEKNKFTFNLLSDFNKEVAPKYGAFYDVFAPGKFDFKGVAKRSAFVVDKDGVIKYAEVLENPGEEPSYDSIKSTLKEL